MGSVETEHSGHKSGSAAFRYQHAPAAQRTLKSDAANIVDVLWEAVHMWKHAQKRCHNHAGNCMMMVAGETHRYFRLVRALNSAAGNVPSSTLPESVLQGRQQAPVTDM